MESTGAAIGWGDLLRVVVALAVLGPLAYLSARLVGRRAAAGPGRVLRVVETVALGQGRALHLVRAGSQVWVIGASAHRVERVGTVTDPAVLVQVLQEHPPHVLPGWAGARRRRGKPGDEGA